MTAIGLFFKNGLPVIVGDIAISGPSNRDKIHLPTTGRVEGLARMGFGYAVVDLKQKAVLVNDRLAIAWTGPLIAAASLLEELFRLREVSLEAVRRCVAAQEPSKATDELGILGCFLDDDAQEYRPFFARGREFKEIVGDNIERFAGTGEEALREAYLDATKRFISEGGNIGGTRLETAIFAGSLCGHMMSRDVAWLSDLLDRFGGGYEAIVIGENGRFQKLDQVVHVFFDANVMGDECVLRPLRIIRPQYIGQLLAVATADLRFPSRSVFELSNAESHVIAPPGIRREDLPPPEQIDVKRFNLGADWVLWHTFVLNRGQWSGLVNHRVYGGRKSPVKIEHGANGPRFFMEEDVQRQTCIEAIEELRRGPN